MEALYYSLILKCGGISNLGEGFSPDETDKRIISFLTGNPDASQAEIARHVGLSQPSVGVRIERLKKMGVVASQLGLSLGKMGLNLAKVDLKASNPIQIAKILERCPRVFCAFITSGRTNMSIFMVGEDTHTLEAVVDHHMRTWPGVLDVDFNLITSSFGLDFFPTRVEADRGKVAPCGVTCNTCSYYEDGRCLGCPATIFYKGDIWKPTHNSPR